MLSLTYLHNVGLLFQCQSTFTLFQLVKQQLKKEKAAVNQCNTGFTVQGESIKYKLPCQCQEVAMTEGR